MRPLYPFNTDTSIMGAVYFFDPLANILPLLPMFILLVGYMKSRGKWNGKFNKFCTFVTNNRSRLYTVLLVVLLVWLTVAANSKNLSRIPDFRSRRSKNQLPGHLSLILWKVPD